MPIVNPPGVRFPLSGNHNIAVGSEALGKLEGASHGMIAIGDEAGKSFTKSAKDPATPIKAFIGIGFRAAMTQDHANNEFAETIAIGEEAYALGTDDGNLVIGHFALSKKKIQGGGNIVIGHLAAEKLGNEAGTAAFQNVIIGLGAGGNVEFCRESVIIGAGAGNKFTAGFLAIGKGAVIIGAGEIGGEHPNDNILIGYKAAFGISGEHPEHNTVIGFEALAKTKENAKENTCLGFKAGSNTTLKSSGNIFIGFEAGPVVEAEHNNELFIHNKAAPSSEALIWGNFGSKQIRLNASEIGFFGVNPVKRHAAIGAVTEEAKVLKERLETVILVLKEIGITE